MSTTKQTDLEARITKLERLLEEHTHDNLNSVKVLFQNIAGLIQVIDSVPTNKPTTIAEQIKLYINGTTYRLYIYDNKNDSWFYSTLI